MNKLIKICLSALFFVSLVSCGTYQISTVPKVKITKVLTVTSTGDTLAVPLRDFQKYHFNNYDFSRFNFYGGYHWNSWQYPYNYWGGIYRPNSWYYRDWYYSPPIYNSPLLRPQVQPTPVPRVQVKGRRGSLNIYNNDQTNRLNIRTPRSSESNNNGGRSRSRENLSPKPVIPRQPNTVQPRQIRRGSGPSIPQQTRTRVNSNNEGRNGSGRIQN